MVEMKPCNENKPVKLRLALEYYVLSINSDITDINPLAR